MATKRLDIEKFRKMLVDERTRLIGQSKRILGRNSLADQSDDVGDLSDHNNHPADAASETFEREKDFAFDENIDQMVDRIDRALAKIDDGTFGNCDRCGKEISKGRLEALPYATFCIECQDIVEGR
jgi:RNA polymerase-binding protein DksA